MTMEEEIKAAVESARKAYETAGRNEMVNATGSEDDHFAPAARQRRGKDEMIGESLDADDTLLRNPHDGSDAPVAGETAGVKTFAHPLPPRARNDDYHAAMRQLSDEPNGRRDGLGQNFGREGERAPDTTDAARAIPAGREEPSESYRILCTAIEQLRQDMNRNHSEAANVATRKDHTRP